MNRWRNRLGMCIRKVNRVNFSCWLETFYLKCEITGHLSVWLLGNAFGHFRFISLNTPNQMLSPAQTSAHSEWWSEALMLCVWGRAESRVTEHRCRQHFNTQWETLSQLLFPVTCADVCGEESSASYYRTPNSDGTGATLIPALE